MNALVDLFFANKDPAFAAWQEAYMRHQFPFLGIRKSIQKRLQAPFLQNFKKEEITTLWKMEEREFQYTAMDLWLFHTPAQADLPLLEMMICTKPWWDTVDIIASKLCGKYFQCFTEKIPITKAWIVHDNLWLRRASLLFQLGYKEKTDSTLLFEYCRLCAQDTNEFIKRAIGWALREFGKTAPEKVLKFLNKEGSIFSALTLREALNRLKEK